MKTFPHLKTPNHFAFTPYNGSHVGSLVSLSAQKHFIENYQTKANDIYLISYPKAGQHLLKKICIELIRHHDKENTHQSYATGDIGFDSVPLKELFISNNPPEAVHERSSSLENTFSLWWTHNPYSSFLANKHTLHPETKYIVINRNPKDVLVSYWNFENNVGVEWGGCDPKLTLNEFLMRFISGMVYCGCYYQWTLDWFNAYNNNIFNGNGQMLWLYYEDILNDPFDEITKVKTFLYNDDVVTVADVNNIVELTRFKKMKKEHIDNPQSFAFGELYFRNGKEKDWMRYLSKEQSDLLDEIMWIKWGDGATAIKYYKEVMDKYADKYDMGYHHHTELNTHINV